MTKLVIGYGNSLRRDDGLGPRLAEQLSRQPPGPDVQALPCHQLTPELAEPISRAELVIFVDAHQSAPAGEVACRALAPAAATNSTLTHAVDAADLLACSRELFGACPPAALVSVGGADFGYGPDLSPIVQTALPLALEQVRHLLARGPAALAAERP